MEHGWGVMSFVVGQNDPEGHWRGSTVPLALQCVPNGQSKQLREPVEGA
jgi:hypothetical protein